MKKIIGKLLYTIKNRGLADPYVEARRNFSKATGLHVNTEQPKKRALVIPYRMSRDSNLFEGNLSVALEQKGYDVDVLLCGGEHKFCEQVDSFRKKWPRCQVCQYEQASFISGYDLNGFMLSELLDEQDYNEIKIYLEDQSFERLSNLKFRNVDISRPLLSAIQLYKKSGRLDLKLDYKLIVGFSNTICKTICALEQYFDKNIVDFVVLSHGVYSTWGAVQEFCLAKGIHFVTWGREYHGAGIIASHNDSYLNEPMYEKNSLWNNPLSISQREQAEQYLRSKVGLIENKADYVSYHKNTKRILPKQDIIKKLNVKQTDVVVGLFPNIPWDGQTFRPAKIFESIEAWIIETINFFEGKSNTYLVIRSHPAELHADGGDGETMKEVIDHHFGNSLPKNIIILPPDHELSSLSVASISNACLLYGSTIGYETMYLRKPTILASDFFYSNKDISYDPIDVQSYFELINEGIELKLEVNDERYERLLKYTYHYQYRRIMPETAMALNGLSFSKFNHKSRDALSKDPSLTRFIECCENNENFYFDDLYDNNLKLTTNVNSK